MENAELLEYRQKEKHLMEFGTCIYHYRIRYKLLVTSQKTIDHIGEKTMKETLQEKRRRNTKIKYLIFTC